MMDAKNKGTGSARRRQKGASLVESALVTITMVSMIVFVMDMGRMLMVQQFIAERARTTVRNAVVNNWSASAVANFLCYNTTVAPSGGSNTAGYLGLVPSQVSYQTLGTSNSSDYRMQVVVSGVRLFTSIPYMSGMYTAAPITATFPAQSLGATN
ncbi:MAG TPA: TadE family protein [Bryobacteraceae bacterium]|nr:TadE family protein [Bryobacteraceae bacterium]